MDLGIAGAIIGTVFPESPRTVARAVLVVLLVWEFRTFTDLRMAFGSVGTKFGKELEGFGYPELLGIVVACAMLVWAFGATTNFRMAFGSVGTEFGKDPEDLGRLELLESVNCGAPGISCNEVPCAAPVWLFLISGATTEFRLAFDSASFGL